MKYAAFKLAGVALSLSLAWTSAQAAALRVAADPVPHAEILNYIKKIDPSLDLKVVELTSGVNANELLASGDVDANYFQHVPYPKDIVENPKHLKILEIESPQIPRSLDDVDLAVINGNYALEAGLVPAKDALGLESAEHNPYANILVTTPALANDPRIKALAKDLTSPQVAEFIRKTYNGSVIPVAPQS